MEVECEMGLIWFMEGGLIWGGESSKTTSIGVGDLAKGYASHIEK